MIAEIQHTDKTFQFDGNLPPLPLPELEQTLIKYLNSIEFLLSDKEYESTVEAIKQFKAGPGETLQNKLAEKAKSNQNWVTKPLFLFEFQSLKCKNFVQFAWFLDFAKPV